MFSDNNGIKLVINSIISGKSLNIWKPNNTLEIIHESKMK